jgi:putative membrane protein
VWVIIAGLVTARARGLRRRRRLTGESGVTTRQRVWFWLGLAAVWVASDWPVGTLGAGYLASVHMAQYMIYTFVAAPLLLLSAPDWWVRKVLARLRLYRTVRWLSRPLYAAIIANVILIGTHAPWTVDNLRASQAGSFLLDAVWFFGGLALWLPVISPLPEQRVASPLLRCVYLFGAAGLAPMIPGGFLTFANSPLYRSYEIAPRVGLDVLDDQQLAGAIMKVGAVPIIWTVIAVIWIRWANTERSDDIASIRTAAHDAATSEPA